MFEILLNIGSNVSPYANLTATPGAKSNVGMVALNGKLYLFGGTSDTKMWVYTPETDTWESKTTGISGRTAFAMVAAKNKIYIFGGWSGSANLGDMWEYDPVAGTSTAKTGTSAMSGHRGFMGLYLGEECVLINGTDGVLRRYQPSANSWTSVFNVGSGSYFVNQPGGLGDDGSYILYGGMLSGSTPSSHQYWYYPGSSVALRAASPNPGNRAYPVMCRGRDKLFLRGSGPATGVYSNDLWEYTASTNKWRSLVPGGIATAQCAIAVLGDKLYSYGGSGSAASTFISANLVAMGSFPALSKLVGPGPATLSMGDPTNGLYGTVASSDLFTGSQLATACGITTGTVINDTVDWLKLSKDGKIIYMPMKSLRYGLSWNDIDSLGIRTAAQNKLITKNGKTYRVRLISGAGALWTNQVGDDPSGCGDSDYDRFIYRLLGLYPASKTLPLLGSYTLSDLGLDSASVNGYSLICQESASSTQYVQRNGGSGNSTDGSSYSSLQFSNASKTATDAFRGWRPILELVS